MENKNFINSFIEKSNLKEMNIIKWKHIPYWKIFKKEFFTSYNKLVKNL